MKSFILAGLMTISTQAFAILDDEIRQLPLSQILVTGTSELCPGGMTCFVDGTIVHFEFEIDACAELVEPLYTKLQKNSKGALTLLVNAFERGPNSCAHLPKIKIHSNATFFNEFFSKQGFILESFALGDWSGKQGAAIVRIEDVLSRPKAEIISTGPMCPPNALCEVDGLNIDLEFDLPICAELSALAYRADLLVSTVGLKLFVDARAAINPAVDCPDLKKVQTRISLVDAPSDLAMHAIILN